ncbi:MAG TPA: KpsF/GutQ family sugar-phosphate isomerase [Longimicrobiales bacterium]|nr:KpsF/GutQ family sugar-phosphate isomerase [Longimicrobiales bacterium]
MRVLSSDEALLAEGRRVLGLEAAAVAALEGRLGPEFVRACRLIHGAKGRVVVSGLGKSGHIARKVAATLTSTGTPATFLHPVEGLHGDLGIVGRDDVAVLVSKSGDTSEMAGLMEYLVRLGVPIIALAGRRGSALIRHATVALDCSVEEEACPMDLAPTSSTTAALAMGDALAVVVLQLKGFEESDFAALHPGGALGRKLTLRVADVMVDEGYPSLGEDATMRQCIVPLAELRGTVPIVDASQAVVGVVTAGDLTRLMERDPDFLDRPVSSVMTKEPQVARPDELGSAAVRRMEKFGVMALPVKDDDGRLVGVVHLHDLMRAGVV